MTTFRCSPTMTLSNVMQISVLSPSLNVRSVSLIDSVAPVQNNNYDVDVSPQYTLHKRLHLLTDVPYHHCL